MKFLEESSASGLTFDLTLGAVLPGSSIEEIQSQWSQEGISEKTVLQDVYMDFIKVHNMRQGGTSAKQVETKILKLI